MPLDLSQLLPLKNGKSRLLGLDVGSKTVGLALSDATWTIATPLETVHRTKFSKDIVHLMTIIRERQVAALVVGWPLNMNGTQGPRCQSVDQFIKNVQEYIQIPIALWDERLSTAAVTRTLLEADVSRKKRGHVVDKMAASFILQGALDALRRQP